MNKQPYRWLWPVSFLAALGQLLLLLTGNEGGPAAARFALACWTFWLPGAFLSHLLIKPTVRVADRIPIHFAAALGVVYFLILIQSWGVGSPGSTALVLCILAVAAALGRSIIPGRPQRTTHIRPGPRLGFMLFLALALGTLHFFLGAPLSLRPDSPDHVAAAAWFSNGGEGALAPALYNPLAGSVDFDVHRGLFHGWVDLLARLSHLPHHAVWDLLPGVTVPMAFLSLGLLGWVAFRDHAGRLGTAAAGLLLVSSFFTNHELMASAHPWFAGLILFWTAAALLLDGLEDPYLSQVLLFALAGLAVWGTHAAFGLGLCLLLVILVIRGMSSLERLQETLPLLIPLAVPFVVLAAVYGITRSVQSGSLDPYNISARSLLILGPGRWTLDPEVFSPLVRRFFWVCLIFTPVVVKAGSRSAAGFYAAVCAPAVLLLGFTPWLLPRVESVMKSYVHVLPWLIPLPLSLVFIVRWALRGLQRGDGSEWPRILALICLAGLSFNGLWNLVRSPAYTTDRILELRQSPPESYRTLAAAWADSSQGSAVVFSDPGTQQAMGALTGKRMAMLPENPIDWVEARGRWFESRNAAISPLTTEGPAHDAQIRAQLEAFKRLGASGWLTNHLAPEHDAQGLSFSRVFRTEAALRALGWRETSLPDGSWFVPPSAPAGPSLPPATSLGPDRPPAFLDYPGPNLTAVKLDSSSVAQAGSLKVELIWSRSDYPEHHDPRGYRVRVELTPVRAPSGWISTVLDSAVRLLTRRPAAAAAEYPVLSGTPTAWWPEGELSQVIVLPCPERLPAGNYEIRLKALPGSSGINRVSPGAVLLRGPSLAGVTVLER